MKIAKIRGFTIIELVVVLVLIGIVSVVVIPRFMRPGTVEAIAARDGLLGAIRSAQQMALGRAQITFGIAKSRGTLIFTAAADDEVLRTFEISTSTLKLETGSAAASADTCASGAAFNTLVDTDFELVFDSLGNLAEFTNDGTTELVNAAFNGVRICVNDSVDMSVCVSPAGYAHAGNCDE